jgi:transcriptional regulator with PAS, ATPase and Fis domain
MAHHIQIPPLRDRQEDIPVLFFYFLKEAASQLGRDTLKVPDEVYETLQGYSFPGNIRELQSMVFDAVSRCTGGELVTGFFKDYVNRQRKDEQLRTAGYGAGLSSDHFPSLREIQDYYFREAFRRGGGSQSAAARLLQISQATLSRWKKKNPLRPIAK